MKILNEAHKDSFSKVIPCNHKLYKINGERFMVPSDIEGEDLKTWLLVAYALRKSTNWPTLYD